MKKKLSALMMTCMLTFALAACGNTGNDGEEPEPELEDTAEAGLVVYFSWSGNTESVALEIRSEERRVGKECGS